MAAQRITDNLGIILPPDDSTNTPWGASVNALSSAFEQLDAASYDDPGAVSRRKSGLSPSADTGAVNAYAIEAPDASAETTGEVFYFKPAHTNTGPATLLVSGYAAAAILKDGKPLTGGEIVVGRNQYVTVNGKLFSLGKGLPATAAVPGPAGTKAVPVKTEPAVDTGSVNAYVIEIPDASAEKTGEILHFKPAHTNTGPATLEVKGYAAAAITKNGEPLTGGEIVAERDQYVIVDGAIFELYAPPPAAAAAK